MIDWTQVIVMVLTGVFVLTILYGGDVLRIINNWVNRK